MAWNVFKFCTALRGLGSIMILLVLAVVGVTYYAVVLCIYGPALLAGGLDSLTALVVLISFHALVIFTQDNKDSLSLSLYCFIYLELSCIILLLSVFSFHSLFASLIGRGCICYC